MRRQQSYDVVGWEAAKPLLRVKWFALFIGWAFQGLLHMDRTERFFKLGMDAGLTIMLAAVLKTFVGLYWAVGLGLVVAHCINFAFNSQPYVLLKHFGRTRYDQSTVLEYAQLVKERINQEGSVLCAGIWGGFARDEHSDPKTPDLDVRIVRRPGVLNGVRACWLVLRERTRANLNQFPLDIYVLDGIDRLSKLRHDEIPIILADPDGALCKSYPGAKQLSSEQVSGVSEVELRVGDVG